MTDTRWKIDVAESCYDGIMIAITALHNHVGDGVCTDVFNEAITEFSRISGWSAQDLSDEFYFRMTDCDHKNQ